MTAGAGALGAGRGGRSGTGRTGALESSPIEIVLAQDVCPTRLTQAAYAAKRQKLEAMLAKGMLTQADFDKYDAELVGCLQ